MKERADIHLVRNGQALSREKAQAMIMAGEVYVGEKKVKKPSEMIGYEDALTVRSSSERFSTRVMKDLLTSGSLL